MEEADNIYDVIIAGGGPIGLILAAELRLANLHVLVLEAAATTDNPLKHKPFGMRAISVASLEAFSRRGMGDMMNAVLEATLKEDDKTPWFSTKRRFAGHFAGIFFDYAKIDAATWPFRLPGPWDLPVVVELSFLEQALAERATASGVEIRLGHPVHSLEQSDDLVTVGAGEQTFSARWLVGCDGGRSTVRKLGGFQFAGTEPELTAHFAQVDLLDPEKLEGTHPLALLQRFHVQPGVLGFVEYDGGIRHRAQPFTLEAVQETLRRVSGTDVTITKLHRATTWTDRTAQATEYRRGRVFLAGDSAHIHSPMGGQGLNLGIGDAMNLGWKLIAAVQGWAPPGLLDTYDAERQPVGAKILEWSRAQIAVRRPDPGAQALRQILNGVLATRDGNTYFAEHFWGLSRRYDLGEGSHALAGRIVPNFELFGDTTLVRLGREGKGFVLDFDANRGLEEVARKYDRVVYVASKAKDQLGIGALLVRPDGIVAWACDEGQVDVNEFEHAASIWFGKSTMA